MNKFSQVGISFTLMLSLASCTQSGMKSESNDSFRFPAGVEADPPSLVYVSYDKNGVATKDQISASRWKGDDGGFSAGGA